MILPSEQHISPGLSGQVAGLRDSITTAACAVPLRARFTDAPHDSRPARVITDRQTGRSATVPLYACGAARYMLAELFPGEEEEGPPGQAAQPPGMCPECGGELEVRGPFDGRVGSTGVTGGHEGFGETYMCPAGHWLVRIQGALLPPSRILTVIDREGPA